MLRKPPSGETSFNAECQSKQTPDNKTFFGKELQHQRYQSMIAKQIIASIDLPYPDDTSPGYKSPENTSPDHSRANPDNKAFFDEEFHHQQDHNKIAKQILASLKPESPDQKPLEYTSKKKFYSRMKYPPHSNENEVQDDPFTLGMETTSDSLAHGIPAKGGDPYMQNLKNSTESGIRDPEILKSKIFKIDLEIIFNDRGDPKCQNDERMSNLNEYGKDISNEKGITKSIDQSIGMNTSLGKTETPVFKSKILEKSEKFKRKICCKGEPWDKGEDLETLVQKGNEFQR